MSELATFVAAVLRDRVVSELVAELDLLRAWKRESEVVMITGPDRTPVYAHGHLKENEAKYSNAAINKPLWKVMLSQINSCSLHNYSTVEVWMNNIRVCPAAEFVQLGCSIRPSAGRITWQSGTRDDIRFIMSGAIDGWTDQAMHFIQNADGMDSFQTAEFVRNDLASAYPFLDCKFMSIVVERECISLMEDRHERRIDRPKDVLVAMRKD